MSTGAPPQQPQETGSQSVGKTGSPEGDLPSLCSAALLRGQKAVTIRHNGALYRLQATRQGKLILTK